MKPPGAYWLRVPLKPINFSSGHSLRDNTVGDYSFHCPTDGAQGFAHMGLVAELCANGGMCLVCGQLIGTTTDVPYQLESTYAEAARKELEAMFPVNDDVPHICFTRDQIVIDGRATADQLRRIADLWDASHDDEGNER